MYNVRVNAEFSPTNTHDPSYTSGTSPREGDLSEIHVVDIYRRKFLKIFFLLHDRKCLFSRCHVSFFFLVSINQSE